MPSRTTSPPLGTVTPSKPLSAFKRLSKRVALYEPSNVIPSTDAPSTVVLCTWLNATPKHIDYYARNYMRLYPSARIILCTITTQEFLFQSESRRRADVSAAVSAILSPDQNTERLFVHSLSNGGGKRVYGIAGTYAALTGNPLPVKAMISDSAPGIPRFRRDIHALQVPIRNLPWAPWLAYMSIFYTVVSVVFVSVNWMPRSFWRELVWGPTDGHNDHQLIDKSCIKGYIYSKNDLAIDWRDVENHASAAEKKGYRVLKKRVEGAEHVQMFRGEGGEVDYWDYIQRVWELGLDAQRDSDSDSE